MASRFKVFLTTTCGDEAIEVASVSAEGQLEGKWPAPAMIHVDREGVGSASSVSVGSITPDNASTKVIIGGCPTARDVRIEDGVVGQIGTSTIVDAKGGHCYEVLTNGFPGVRLESKRIYERPIDLFLPPEAPLDKIVLRRCEHGSASFAALMGKPATTMTPPPPTLGSPPTGAFTANPLSKSHAKPPPTHAPKPPPKPPRKPRH